MQRQEGIDASNINRRRVADARTGIDRPCVRWPLHALRERLLPSAFAINCLRAIHKWDSGNSVTTCAVPKDSPRKRTNQSCECVVRNGSFLRIEGHLSGTVTNAQWPTPDGPRSELLAEKRPVRMRS
jgi:hypothetical protein